MVQQMAALYTSMAMEYKCAALSSCMGRGYVHSIGQVIIIGITNPTPCLPYISTSGLFSLKHALLGQELSTCQLPGFQGPRARPQDRGDLTGTGKKTFKDVGW